MPRVVINAAGIATARITTRSMVATERGCRGHPAGRRHDCRSGQLLRERWARTLARLPQRCIEHQRRLFERDSSKKMRWQSSAAHSRTRSAFSAPNTSIASRAIAENVCPTRARDRPAWRDPPARAGGMSGVAANRFTTSTSAAAGTSPALTLLEMVATARWSAPASTRSRSAGSLSPPGNLSTSHSPSSDGVVTLPRPSPNPPAYAKSSATDPESNHQRWAVGSAPPSFE